MLHFFSSTSSFFLKGKRKLTERIQKQIKVPIPVSPQRGHLSSRHLHNTHTHTHKRQKRNITRELNKNKTNIKYRFPNISTTTTATTTTDVYLTLQEKYTGPCFYLPGDLRILSVSFVFFIQSTKTKGGKR